MATSPRWVRHAEVAWVATEDRIALLDLDHLDRPPFILEGSSAVIWELMDDGVDEHLLVQRVAEAYHVSVAEVTGPVLDFLRELQGLGLIRAESR